MKKSKKPALLDGYIGTSVVGDRGQIVIPKDLRDDVRLKPGDRVVMFRHQSGPIVMMPMDAMKKFMNAMSSKLSSLQDFMK